MNAVVYARYSSHKQGEQSIEGQLAAAACVREPSDMGHQQKAPLKSGAFWFLIAFCCKAEYDSP